VITNQDILHVISRMDLRLDVPSLRPDNSLASQGVDSLDMATLLLELEGQFGRVIPPEEISQLRTIEQIVRYLNQEPAAAL